MAESFDPANYQGRLPSPCISHCVMAPETGLCQGCLRNIDEIVGWASASEARKRTIWLATIERRSNHPGPA
jgi:predicted Fe-S protein YdhL (DUF1289 family)